MSIDDTAIGARRAQVAAELADHTIYELLGGEAGIRRLVDTFYAVMDSDPVYGPLRRMHQPDLGPMRVSLFEYLSGWLGGPPLFVERHGSPCISHAHQPFTIGAAARDMWVDCMTQAMDESGVQLRYREVLMPALERMAEMMRNAD